MPAPPLLDLVEAGISESEEGAVAAYKGLRLTSMFQPVFGLAHGRPVGYEGLLRAADDRGTVIPPAAVFSMAAGPDEVVFLDTLCRALHTRNFARMSKEHWLFLNVTPLLVSDRFQDLQKFLGYATEHCGLPPNRIVIEVLESALSRDMAVPMAFYREQGCLLAVDDFGAGHSNLDRVWRLRPDVVKLDRVLLQHTTVDRTARTFLKRMVSTMHEAGSLMLIEGVETESEAVTAMDAEVDLTQGYYFARPATSLAVPPETTEKFEQLYRMFNQIAMLESKDFRAEIGPYIRAIERAANLMRSGMPFGKAVDAFLELAHAERCYLLDRSGRQIGHSLLSKASASKPDPRFDPLTYAERAYWGHRPYFRRAVIRAGAVHITRPYLSLPTAEACVTVSIALAVEKVVYVLCGDVKWSELFSTDVTIP